MLSVYYCITGSIPFWITVLEHGRLSIPLSQAGHDVIAVEQSLPMLNILRQKALDLSLTIQTENCKIQDYNERIADIALSVFTVLNYTTVASELVKIFSNIHKRLNDKGLFFFDLADWVFFQHRTLFDINQVNFKRLVEISPVRENNYTYFESCSGVKNGRSFSYKDSFLLRYWTNAEVDTMLVSVGFKRVNMNFPEFNGTGSTYYLYQRI